MSRPSSYEIIVENKSIILKKKCIINEKVKYEECLDDAFEKDSNIYAWKRYLSCYDDKFDFNNFRCVSSNKIWRIICNATPEGKNVGIEVGGDVVFNFNQIKRNRFCKIINDDIKYNSSSHKKRLKAKIDKLEEKHHNLCNFSICPRTGNLQGIKQGLGNDRFDTLVWAIHMYYLGYKTFILNSGSNGLMKYDNVKSLKNFLDQYENIYDYCESMYLINDNRYIDLLLVSGAKAIDSCDRVQEYVSLAEIFWTMQENNYKELINKQKI